MRRTIPIILSITFITISCIEEPQKRNEILPVSESQKELLKNYKSKFNLILKMKKERALLAAIYTQTTDAKGEANGLITYNRKKIKIPFEILAGINQIKVIA